MANQGPSYGFSREVKMKMAAKYDEYVEEDLREWIAASSGQPAMRDQSFQNWLKDGRVLCYLVETLQPGILKKGMPHESMLNPFRCMENISTFLDAIKVLGVPEPSLCTTADLYDGSGMPQVQTCLLALVDHAMSRGLTDTDIGLHVSEKQKRNWSKEQLRAGESIIGLQAGTNKCASRAGMTAYGASRPIFDKKYTSNQNHTK
uniref:Calponin-3-like n=1 Tax=Phallusia mammillata TaxID=59560 RepID=A0A6F9DA75_9ASCI|nr:calponin-3-like [Phallusia mammillata]